MSGHIKHWEVIDFTAKNDRELLLLVAQRQNDIAEHLEGINGSVAETKKQVRELQDWKNKIIGAFAIFTILLPLAVSAIIKYVL